MGRLTAGLAVALAIALPGVTAGCSSGPRGLGRGACPYVRPRLIRLDVDRSNGHIDDIGAVAADFAAYVRTNLPAGGKAKSDQALVRFSGALTAFHRTQSAIANPTDANPTAANPADATLTAAEEQLKAECRAPGA